MAKKLNSYRGILTARQMADGINAKELCLVRRILELIEAGIKGFKIEGRMRSPSYVAVATRLYRKAIDSCLKGDFVLPPKEMEEIEVVFNREFTEGLIFGEVHLTSPPKPMNCGVFLGEVKNGEVHENLGFTKRAYTFSREL